MCHIDMRQSVYSNRSFIGQRLVFCIAIILLAMMGFAFSSCADPRSMTYEQMRNEYDPEADGYNYADDYDDYYYDYMGY